MRTAVPKRKYRRRVPVSGAGMVKCEEEEKPVTAPSLRYMAGSECLVNLTELNPYILCSICKGYFVDATTITECLHTYRAVHKRMEEALLLSLCNLMAGRIPRHQNTLISAYQEIFFHHAGCKQADRWIDLCTNSLPIMYMDQNSAGPPPHLGFVCKSCIVKHFYYSNRCPKCNVVVHQTQPLYNIRLDRQLQDIVYKLVVNLEEREKKQMFDFYSERGLEIPKPTVPQPNITNRGRPRKLLGPVFRIPPELDVSLLLEFIGAQEGTGSYKPLEKKFVRVSGEATIGHVEKFLRRKMELTAMCQVDIICGDHLLEHYQTLREILSAIGKSAVQDGLLVLHFGLVLSPLSFT